MALKRITEGLTSYILIIMTEKQLTLSNGSIAYWESNAKNKPTLVYIHGFRGTHHGLQLVIDKLPDIHSVAPDLPGFGESDMLPGEHNLEGYIEFVREFIEALELPQPPILVGHSFGSIIASHYAARYGNTIEKLILINPIAAPALAGPKVVATKIAQAYYLIGSKLPDKLSHLWLGWAPIIKITSLLMTVTKDPQIRAYAHNQHKLHFSEFKHPRVVREAFTASVEHSVRDVAHQIEVESLLIAADKDQITSLSDQQATAQQFKNARLHVIHDVGHLIHYETPAEAAGAITDFIS